jgi:hypothetical protein
LWAADETTPSLSLAKKKAAITQLSRAVQRLASGREAWQGWQEGMWGAYDQSRQGVFDPPKDLSVVTGQRGAFKHA